MKAPQPLAETAAGAFPLRRFAATRISRAIEESVRAPRASGVLEGVHRTAVNIRWADRLVTVAHLATGGLPNGILVEPPVALDQIGLAPGMPVPGDGLALRIPGASMVVLLAGASSWSPALPVLEQQPSTARADLAQRALKLAAVRVPHLGLGPLLIGLVEDGGSVGSLGRAAARPLAAVLAALNEGSAHRAVAAAAPLIGLGPGATPSGDDLLVGLAAGLAVTEHPLAGAFAAGVAREAAGLTTSVSECYLLHAGRLEFSERVHDAAVAILVGPEAGLERAITTALSWGASSGADVLVGLVAGVAAPAPWLTRRLRACAQQGNVAA